jgi:NAD(P)H dehydrogenase (quinone)
MSVVVTGATGQLGRLVVEALLDRGVPAAGIVAAGRNVEKLDDLAARGVQVRQIDFTEPATLAEAFAGAEKVLLVSSSEVGQRAAQHRNAIAAAREAGVGLLAYTSIAKADTTSMLLAAEHRETEEAVRESGIPFVFLRNGWYLENYTAQLPVTLEHGAVLGSGGDGKVSAATRADFAAAAAEVLVGDGHAGQVYELGGDEAFTLPELAAEVSRQSGTEVVYRDLPVDDYKQVLVGVGLPEPAAAVLADSDLGIARGELFVDSGDLSRLIGRPTTPLASAVASALGR